MKGLILCKLGTSLKLKWVKLPVKAWSKKGTFCTMKTLNCNRWTAIWFVPTSKLTGKQKNLILTPANKYFKMNTRAESLFYTSPLMNFSGIYFAVQTCPIFSYMIIYDNDMALAQDSDWILYAGDSCLNTNMQKKKEQSKIFLAFIMIKLCLSWYWWEQHKMFFGKKKNKVVGNSKMLKPYLGQSRS